MKYSEYLKLVKSRVPTFPCGSLEGSICIANYEPAGEDLTNILRLSRAVGEELLRLEQVTGRKIYAFYPQLKAFELGIVKAHHEVNGIDPQWRQDVRHQLLDKWIAEAEAEEEGQ